MNKTSVAILIGGKSAEHNISLCSGYNLLNAIDKSKFEPILIGITKEGVWTLQNIEDFLAQDPAPDKIQLQQTNEEILISLGNVEDKFYLKSSQKPLAKIDVMFPMLHGPNGEDGSIQGIFEHLNLPYVGTNVISSAICMDKEIAKRIMINAGIPTCNFIALHTNDDIDFKYVKAKLGLPLIIKPCNLGSSIGISKVSNEDDFNSAIKTAFNHDNRILIEEFVNGREIEFAVLGNKNPLVSLPGEYVHPSNFFDYETKYLKGQEIKMLIPADGISDDKIKEYQSLALKTYQALACEGLSRVDIFLTDDGRLFVNEVNTMPGFTNTSMYPSLIGELGINYADLITRLIELSIERFKNKK